VPEIGYVCLSDLHLGEEDALLTDYVGEDAPPKAGKVLQELVRCLRLTLKACGPPPPQKPTLILNGDVLEFALAPVSQAAMAFDQFIGCIMPKGDELFERILVVPGNHDHHLWQTAQETQYVNFLERKGFPPGKPLKEPWHTTNIFVENADAVPSGLLTRLMSRYDHLSNQQVLVAYPNFGLVKPDLEKCVIFHHGHYVESLYHLMSALKSKALIPGSPMPLDVWEIEAENFSWIEFFWSTMGEAGQVGAGIESVYDAIQNPDRLGRLLVDFIRAEAPEHHLPDIPFIDEEKVMQSLFASIARRILKSEKLNDNRPLSGDARDGLKTYWNDSVKSQIQKEIQKRGEELRVENIKEEVLVFGHTHKPFSWHRDDPENPIGIPIYNTGGWVVDTGQPAVTHGASMVLLDENLDSASILLYKETNDGNAIPVTVEWASGMSDPPSAFLQRIQEQMRKNKDAWQPFADTVAATVRDRREKVLTRELRKQNLEQIALQTAVLRGR
jgi:hypothetical protein